jgi:electron transport complex protein RnfG
MNALVRQVLKSSGILLSYAVVGTSILAFIYSITHVEIEKNEANARRALLSETLVPHSYNNDLVANQFTLTQDPLLGNDGTTSLAWQARMNNTPVAVVLEATAPDGYGGKIKLLIGVAASGQITGVRVVEQHETPGLGDYIDRAKSNWILGFDGKSLQNTPDEAWQVKKDGGQFDYMTGATISPRAVIEAVHHALQYAKIHHASLFAASAAANLTLKQQTKGDDKY